MGNELPILQIFGCGRWAKPEAALCNPRLK